MIFPAAATTRRLSCLGLLALATLLAGCGAGPLTTSTAGSLAVAGHVHGGIQPITGSTVQLYAVGTTGPGSQATPMLNQPVMTDSQGGFSITGDFTCPSAGTQVYLVARGGNPGFASNVNNPALVLMTALGNCGDVLANPSRALQLNEVTTVAAGYALAPFIASYDHIGATSTNATGMANAFLNSHLLADTSTGLAAQLPSNLSTEPAKLYALADALVPCVNSDGGAACAPLYAAASASGGTAPTDVLGALLGILRNPGRNVTAVYRTIGSTPPFATTLTAVPNDWTMSLTVTGGGLAEPTGLAVDGLGNVWVTNYGGDRASGLVAFSPQGTPFAGTPFGAGLQTESYGLTIDKNGDAWMISKENVQTGTTTGSVAKFRGASSSTPGAVVGQFYDSTIDWPESIASDPSGSGSILIGNYLGGTVTFYNLSGAYVKNLGGGVPEFPVSVTSDNAGGAWVGDQGDANVLHLLANSSVVSSNCCNGAQTVALDQSGDVWVSNYFPYGQSGSFSFSEVAPNGTVIINKGTGGGLSSPGGAAVDAAGQFWIANYNSATGSDYGSFSEIAGNSTSVSAGTPLSPGNGFGLDARMLTPYAAVPDASGNLWVSVRNGDSLRMFFGVAAPTATPATPIPQAP